MRAMLLENCGTAESSPIHLREIPEPSPGPGEILVRVHCCGVCHTDLHIIEGDLGLPRLPIVPGHQIVGVVSAVGRGVKTLKEGARVGIPWLHSTCGTCHFCSSGSENLCENARFTGLHVNGGYADSVVIREDFAYPLPARFADESAAPLLCAGVIGYRSYRLSQVRSGECLGLYGFGASAHIVLQLARHYGCEVAVFTRTPAHQDLARQLGAAWVGRAEAKLPRPLDAAILFAPAGNLVPHALRALRKGGTLALAGITMSPIPELDYATLYHERILRSVANSTRRDVREFLDLAAAIPISAEVQTYTLEEANHALLDMKHSRIRGAAVLTLER
jgi:propanol-preferring alcohol dehydrogenase